MRWQILKDFSLGPMHLLCVSGNEQVKQTALMTWQSKPAEIRSLFCCYRKKTEAWRSHSSEGGQRFVWSTDLWLLSGNKEGLWRTDLKANLQPLWFRGWHWRSFPREDLLRTSHSSLFSLLSCRSMLNFPAAFSVVEENDVPSHSCYIILQDSFLAHVSKWWLGPMSPPKE